MEDQVEIVARVGQIIDKFPENNKKLIKTLFNFLYPAKISGIVLPRLMPTLLTSQIYLLSSHQSENKLTRSVLASVFGPILLPPRVNEDSSLVAKVIRLLISVSTSLNTIAFCIRPRLYFDYFRCMEKAL